MDTVSEYSVHIHPKGEDAHMLLPHLVGLRQGVVAGAAALALYRMEGVRVGEGGVGEGMGVRIGGGGG